MDYMTKEKKIALILAGGSGARMKQDIPKQFITVNDKPVIIYTLEIFQSHSEIDEIYIGCIESWANVLPAYISQFNITKCKNIITGGDTGQETINKLVDEIKKTCKSGDIVIIHDANRPLITHEIINDNIAVCKKYNNATAAIPEHTTTLVKEKDEVGSVELFPREKIVRTQTPNTFRLSVLADLYDEANKKGIKNMTAACSLMVALGKRVYFSKGSERNFKITTTEDLELFKALLQGIKLVGLK
jgi:2-C-methyl-D-erythritol 4-phosphate cytidylyltransferase